MEILMINLTALVNLGRIRWLLQSSNGCCWGSSGCGVIRFGHLANNNLIIFLFFFFTILFGPNNFLSARAFPLWIAHQEISFKLKKMFKLFFFFQKMPRDIYEFLEPWTRSSAVKKCRYLPTAYVTIEAIQLATESKVTQLECQPTTFSGFKSFYLRAGIICQPAEHLPSGCWPH